MVDSTEQEWRNFGSIKGEHIWQGDKHIADIVDDINNSEHNKVIQTIANSAVLMHNDPSYKMVPELYKACEKAGSVLSSVLRGGTIDVSEIREAYEELRLVLLETKGDYD